ncbi:hepatic sodium/bile acid cotransporter [Rhineura floridana]|uniref:hepatic sodium/bile acid cotransporter n=1 Tax=Rhineura floridana TaxID=261503 RepID=UPI002AC7F93C|nr:hepatic sodium/bile acid cotransporter [Rhineura floridana]
MIVLLLLFIPIIALSVIHLGSRILINFSPRLLGTACLMPVSSFSLGDILSAFFSFSDHLTVCLETGFQNVQLCFTILKMTFAPEVIGPLFIFPSLYLIFQLGECLLLVIFRSYEKIKEPNGKYNLLEKTNTPSFLSTSTLIL